MFAADAPLTEKTSLSPSVRRPHAPRIALEDVFVVPKTPRLLVDMKKTGLGQKELLRKYASEGESPETVLSSTIQQLHALGHLSKVIPLENFVTWEALSEKALSKAKAVIALGGDGHMVYVSRFIKKQLLIGVNSDHLHSRGDLLPFVPSDLQSILAALNSGKYTVKKWPRLQATVDGKKISPASSEYFLGEDKRLDPSKYTISLKGKHAFHAGSGLIVNTGAGSTGFSRSAGRYGILDNAFFPPESRQGHFVCTEPMEKTFETGTLLSGTLRPGDVLNVVPVRTNHALISSDGFEIVPITKGQKISFSLSKDTFNVLTRC